MNWLILIITVAVIAFLVSKLNGDNTKDSAENAGAAAIGCGYIILQILIAALTIWAIIALFGWLF